jgi:hypothetical protein
MPERSGSATDEYSDPDVDDSSGEADDYSEEFLDVDIRNMQQPWKVAKYAERIMAAAQRDIPTLHLSSELIRTTQRSITTEDRKAAIASILQIQRKLGMTSDTLFQSVTYFNAALARQAVAQDRLALLALTCLWMGSKIEEGRGPKLTDILCICPGKYTPDDFVTCERHVIALLDFRLCHPTAKLFLRRLIDSIHGEEEIVIVSNFFCDLSLIPIEFLDFTPDVIALAAVCLGKLTIGAFCPTKRLMAYGHIHEIDTARRCCGLLLERAETVVKDPGHVISQRYGNPEWRDVMNQMKLSQDLLARL